MNDRPQITVVFAITADGKISDAHGSPGRFGSPADRAHLEKQVAQADAVLMGAGTLRSEGLAMPVLSPELIQGRVDQGKPPQPTQIICSASGAIDPGYGFFRQAVPRWLLTTEAGSRQWLDRWSASGDSEDPFPHSKAANGFDRILLGPLGDRDFQWPEILAQLAQEGIQQLAVLGGGNLVGSLLSMRAIDHLWLTVCPLLVGGAAAPTPMDGVGLPLHGAQWLNLVSAEAQGQEVFLHYQRRDTEP